MKLNSNNDTKFIGETMCGWHPLTHWVNYVLYYSKDQKNLHNFKEKLDYVVDKFEDEQLAEIFRPLDITCHDKMVLFKYKNYVELEDMGYKMGDFFDYENGLYRECRSVVFDENNGCIVLTAMPKFKNYGEDSEPYRDWSTQNLNKIYEKSFKFYITEKMDGSFQQYTYDPVREGIVGSGSSALDDSLSWRLAEGYDMVMHKSPLVDMLYDYPEYTFMFEFIHPHNPIVVHYTEEDKGLYLIGMRNKYTGEEINYSVLENLVNYYNNMYEAWDEGAKKGIQMVKYYDEESLDSILGKLDKYTSNEKEGWVVDCWNYNLSFSHLRFKVKVDDYVLMHKALSKMVSPNAVIQCLSENLWDDLYAKIPVAYKDYAEKLKDEIVNYNRTIAGTYAIIYTRMLETLEDVIDDKKAVMLWIQNNVPKFLRGYIINCYLGKSNNVLKNGGGGYRKKNELQELAERCDRVNIRAMFGEE